MAFFSASLAAVSSVICSFAGAPTPIRKCRSLRAKAGLGREGHPFPRVIANIRKRYCK
jgi:hypothetical protein